jgi:peptidoglycan/xylan/chitin deacetylase (PgdA/CDA1 family)
MLSLLDRAEMLALSFVPLKPVRNGLKRPVASFSFDDVPQSAARDGARILEERGVRGTYYLCGGNAGSTFEGSIQFGRDDLAALSAQGHEIGCHSYSHMRMRRVEVADMQADLDANVDYLSEAAGIPDIASFAYPYGSNDLATKRYAAKRFETARGVVKGVNAGTIDFADLKTLPIEKRKFSLDLLDRQIALAKALNGWIVFYTHDVADDCTNYGCTGDQLKACVDTVQAAGIEVLTVAEAAEKVMGPG